MDPVSALFLVALLAVPTAYTMGAVKHARANGRAVPSRADWKPRWPAMFTRHPATATPTASGGKAKVKTSAKGRPQTVPRILAAGLTENWVASREHRRANPKQSRRHRVFDRLVVPGRGPAPQPPAPAVTPAAPAAPGPARDAAPAEAPSPAPSPTLEGQPMSDSPGGSGAGDLGSALTRVITEGEAGGLKSKTRTALVLGEGHRMSGEYLDQYARHLQEKGEYPPFAWEPVRQAAAMIKAAASKLTEHGTAMETIARTPMGEAAGKGLAPAKPELDRE